MDALALFSEQELKTALTIPGARSIRVLKSSLNKAMRDRLDSLPESSGLHFLNDAEVRETIKPCEAYPMLIAGPLGISVGANASD